MAPEDWYVFHRREVKALRAQIRNAKTVIETRTRFIQEAKPGTTSDDIHHYLQNIERAKRALFLLNQELEALLNREPYT